MLLAALLCVGSVFAAPDPQAVFENPPQSAKTGVWWHWMGSNVSRDGIVKDLDWFKDTGIGAATIFGMADICTPWAAKIENCPSGKLLAFTPEWWRLVKFACEEAEKRGIEIGIHNCPGYTSTGGPWIPPRLAMRELVFNVTNAERQISLKANALFPVQNGETGAFEKPDVPSRRTDLQEIAVVDGVRVQHIPMGAFTQPNQWELFGLECDKMNPEAVALHLDKVLGDMKKYVGEQVGRGLKFMLLDSYEAGKPTWTPKMRDEFKARRGYDPLPFLPILGGFKVAAAPDKDAEKKFKADYDRTIKELYRDVLFKMMREKVNAAGLEFACEPYGGPFDSRECAAHVDRLMTEFWFKPERNRGVPKPLDWNQWTGPNGKKHNVIEAEAFTSGPPSCNWTETPALLKAAADEQFARGVNRMVLHACPLQPWGDDVKPGKVMGRWGTHFGRNQTWAKSGKGFFDYLNRCSALLQWGEPGKDKVSGLNITPKRTQVSSLCREADGRSLFFVANHSGHAVTLDLGLTGKDISARWFDPVTGKIVPVEVKDGKVAVSLPAHGSCFLEKTNKKPAKVTKCPEGEGDVSVPLRGAFAVAFGDVEIKMPTLKDWTAFEDARIKYFSGTAFYKTTFDGVPRIGSPAMLSLGNCNGQIAKVVLNGRNLGTVWCEPYEVEIPSGVLKAAGNVLEIEFTNVWANRLIGDEQEMPDCDFVKATFPGGWYLSRFPDWFKGDLSSRPSKGRKCFTDWNYFTKDSPLVPSGLLGPVVLRVGSGTSAFGVRPQNASQAAKTRPVPAKSLLERMRSGVDVIGIVHFGINTFTDREWGYGSESPNEFNPTDFNADQIVKSCRDGGLKGLVVVAKHHDGFCLWPTKTTDHNVTKSPFRRDYVKEMESACRKYGLKFGVYCSPWDRNNAAYGSDEYVKTFHAQVEELNDGRYGEIFEMWFDGANGGDGYYGGAWEKRSIGVARKYYRMNELWARVRELQPGVCFFGGEDGFAWPGNERGEVNPESGGTRDNGTFQIYEADFPLRPGWFYHASQDGFSRSGEFLMKIYLRTVGNGATMDVGISPDRRGRLTDEDAGCLRRFGEIRKAFFSKPVKSASSPFNVIVMTEDIERGERIDQWRVVLDGRELAKGGKIGTKRIRVFDRPVSGKNLCFEVLKGDAKPDEIKLELFMADEELVGKVMASEAPKRAPAPFELSGVLMSRKQSELVYMMKAPRKISSIVLTPDAGAIDGTPIEFCLAYSSDGKSWVKEDTVYRLGNIAANPVPQTVALSKTANIKYLKIFVRRMLKDGSAARFGGVEFVP